MSVISFGGGVNSTAMTILLVNRGWRGPILFADTETEWPETYCFKDYFEREWLKPRGLEIVRLGGDYRTQVPGRDRRPLIEFCEDYRCTPMAGMRWCTQGWKTDVINHWCKEHGETEQLLAISTEEAYRQKGRLCPLIDYGIDRKDCIKIIEAEGLSVPEKSSCYICSFTSPHRWYTLYKRHPELYERVARLEELSSERRNKKTILSVRVPKTLRELERTFRDQIPMFDDSVTDELLAYKPCICGL